MHLVEDDLPYDDDSFTLEHVGRYVTAAADAGIDEIGFTDHVYRFAEARDLFDHALWQAEAVGGLGRYPRARGAGPGGGRGGRHAGEGGARGRLSARSRAADR